MFIPNEIINIIFSFKESPFCNRVMKELIDRYNDFINVQNECKSAFHIFYFRLFLPIWKRWPENYPVLKKYNINK
jgi:hypothetical protein